MSSNSRYKKALTLNQQGSYTFTNIKTEKSKKLNDVSIVRPSVNGGTRERTTCVSNSAQHCFHNKYCNYIPTMEKYVRSNFISYKEEIYE